MTSKKKYGPVNEKYQNLDVKIGSKQEKNWTDVLTQAEALIEKGMMDLEINHAIVELAKKRIVMEKEKFK